MANTTIDQLTSLTGTGVATNDLFLVYDASANTEKSITSSEVKSMIGNGPLTITTTSTSDALIVTSTDSGAGDAPDIIFYRNSANAAVNDLLGNIIFRGKNSAGVDKNYAGIYTGIASPTSSSESGFMILNTMSAGTLTERVRIREDGNIGIGIIGSNNINLSVSKNITGQINSYGIWSSGAIQSDVTTSANYFISNAVTANSTFTLPTLRHYWAYQGSFGASSTVTNQYGFVAEANMVGATNNYGFAAIAVPAANVTVGKTVFGFYSNNPIASGGGTSYNFYGNGTAPNYFGGNVGIGALSSGSKLHVSGNTYISGAVTLATALPTSSGGTGVLAVSTAGAYAALLGYTSTATAAGTTTLTNASTQYQLFTGATTQTVVLPVTSTLTTGWTFHIVNNSTGNLTVQSSGLNTIITVYPNMTAMVTCILASGTTAASWEAGYTDFGTITGTGANVMDTSPTITTPAITGGTINNTVIGGTTQAAGSFTTVVGTTSVLSSGTGGVGYSTGSGGAITQLTSRVTGVTLDKTAGAITLFTAAGTATPQTFTVTNSTVAATDVIVLNQKSGSNLYILLVTAVAAGSFNVTFYTTGGTASDAPVINYAVIKAVAA